MPIRLARKRAGGAVRRNVAFFDFSVLEEEGAGFGLFSPWHFLWLLLCASASALLCLLYRRGDGRRRRVLALSTAAAAAGAELLRTLALAAAGLYGVGWLPLHLCTLAAWLTLLHALRGGRLLGQFLYAFCMPGALAALLLPDWARYPPLHFMTACAFLFHTAVAAYVLMLLFGGALRPEPPALPACLGLMLTLALPVGLFDRLTGTNYMFLNWPPEGTPLAWFAFLGRPGYLLGYLPLAAAVWAPLYLPFTRGKRPGESALFHKKGAD